MPSRFRCHVVLGVIAGGLVVAGQASAQAPPPEQPPAAAREAPAPPPATPPAPVVPTPPPQNALQNELDAILKAGPAHGAGAPTTPAPSAPARGGLIGPLNPDISVIADVTAGGFARAPLMLAGDDPDLGGSRRGTAGGITLQEIEVAFQQVVDPYFRFDLFLTIPNLSGLEVEEAFFTTLTLPGNFQVRGGIFRSALGRQNGQHLHIQDFTRRPLINEAFLGTDGLRAPTGEVSWLLPLPFYAQLIGEVITVGGVSDSGLPLATFGGGTRADLTYAGALKMFFPASESVSIYPGLSFASGKTGGTQIAPATPAAEATLVGEGQRSYLYGADLYVKWKPANIVQGYQSLAWQTEYLGRRIDPGPGPASPSEVEGGLYSQLVGQISRRWFVGGRYDLLGLPEGRYVRRTQRAAGSITFTATEFSRIRLYGEYEWPDSTFATAAGTIPPTAGPIVPLGPLNNYGLMLQVELALGAHGAHPF